MKDPSPFFGTAEKLPKNQFRSFGKLFRLNVGAQFGDGQQSSPSYAIEFFRGS